jgi:3-oxoadipate CoA-transferase, alpha subunit
MINKIARSIADAMAGIQDGATVLIGGFGTAGIPNELIDGLIEQGAKDLTVVNNNAGNAEAGLAQDHLQLSASSRQLRVRRALSFGQA